jgi:hypothetical protein
MTAAYHEAREALLAAALAFDAAMRAPLEGPNPRARLAALALAATTYGRAARVEGARLGYVGPELAKARP